MEKMPKKDTKGIFERPPGSGVWWCCWYDGQGKRHREKCGTKTIAKQVYTRRKAAVLEQRKLPELRRRDLTIADLVERYSPEILAKNAKSAGEYQRNGQLWTEELGQRLAVEVVPGDIEGWKVGRSKRYAASTVNGSLRYLKMLYNLALRDELVSTNPLASGRVKLLRECNQRERILEPVEEEQLAAHLPRELWLKVQIGLHTGLRQSEQLEGQRKHVRLDRRQVFLPDSKGDRKGKGEWVRLNQVALDAYREVLEGNKIGVWVWLNKLGTGPVDGTSVTKRLQRAATKLGIHGLTWHCLRHTFISRLCMAGVPLPTVQKLARHRSIQMTLRYAHLCPDHTDQALQLLEGWGKVESLSASPPKQPPSSKVSEQSLAEKAS